MTTKHSEGLGRVGHNDGGKPICAAKQCTACGNWLPSDLPVWASAGQCIDCYAAGRTPDSGATGSGSATGCP
jgi:hypothetical protein